MSKMTEPPVSPRRICVFDHMRTVSQMFNKLFANLEELEPIFYPFFAASMYGPERIPLICKHSNLAEDT